VTETLKIVFDTQIFLRALINPKSVCGKLLSPQWRGDYHLYISDAIQAEIVDVLNRPSVRQKFPHITDALVQETARILKEEAERVDVETVEAISRDPKDDIFLACAKTAAAHYLVSEDNDLLVLTAYNDTIIVNALRFLAILESRKLEQP
jgi:uncharacterized protein